MPQVTVQLVKGGARPPGALGPTAFGPAYPLCPRALKTTRSTTLEVREPGPDESPDFLSPPDGRRREWFPKRAPSMRRLTES